MLLAASHARAQSAGDYLFQKKSSSGPLAGVWITPAGPPSLFGYASGTATSFTLGDGLSLSGSILSATAGGLTVGTTTVTGGTNGYALVNNAGQLGEVSLASYLTTATAASTYLTLSTAASTYLTTSSAASSYQPLDSDLTSIAALTTTSFGRDLLTRADAAATRSALGLGTLATQSATISDYLTLATAASTYQPLDSHLTSFAGLADAAGVLTNNGSGTFSYTATSTGGNALGTDAGKIAVYSENGEITAASAVRLTSGISVMGIWFGSHRLASSGSGFTKTWTLPNVTGTLITTGDTGTVTDGMLAGSIALSKLAQSSATTGQAIAWNGTAWAPTTISTGLTIGTTAITSGTSGTVLYNNGGTLGQMTTSGSGTQLALTTSPTITTPVIARINDASGNETLMLSSTASAVNEVTIANAATGNPPTIRPTGGDTNIDLSLGGKGTGWTRVVSSSETTGGLFLTVPGTWNAGDVVTIAFGDTTANSGIVIPWSSPHEWRGYFGVRVIGGVPGGTISLCTEAANTISFGATSDTFFGRDAVSVLQLGRDAASPSAQTLKAHDASGTNIDGASLTISGGTSTGTGDDGDVILSSTMTGSSGSSANTQQTRSQVVARFRNLTESTATNLVSIALPSSRVTGGTATITVWANDGTDFQTITSEVRFGAVNKAGTVTATCTQTDGTTAASAGTLTVTYDATTSGNNVILRANATSSLTQTILRSRIVITALNGDDTQVVTPQ